MDKQAFTIEAVEFIDGGCDRAEEARVTFKSHFPGRSARRMTHLGMMVGVCLQKVGIARETPIVFASTFAESASLERFIDSFPEASPAMFQSSIHPSSVEQALIPNKQAIDRFYPITSDRNLSGQILESAFLLAENEITLLGGEEAGSWLCEQRLASCQAFAFGMKLKRGGEGLGTVSLDRSSSIEGAACPSFPEFARALGERHNLRIPSFALDAWIRIEWR